MDIATVNAVISGLTLAVVGAAAIAALVQLRHLRAANNLNGLLSATAMFNSETMRGHFAYVFGELHQRMQDPEYVRQLREGPADRTVHRELLVCDFYEQIGAYLKHGLLDESVFLDLAGGSVLGVWRACLPAIRLMRARSGPAWYENFEYAAIRAREAQRRHPNGMFPRNMKRWDESLDEADA